MAYQDCPADHPDHPWAEPKVIFGIRPPPGLKSPSLPPGKQDDGKNAVPDPNAAGEK